MATRAIVTSQPIVPCDVCGRRLLRGETPDVFLAGGQRRTVCELCVPRAAAEGWQRESDEHEPSIRPTPPRRGSLLGRLRQLREGEQRPLRRQPERIQRGEKIDNGVLYETEDPLYDYLEGGSTDGPASERALYIGAVPADAPAPLSAAVEHAEVEAAVKMEVTTGPATHAAPAMHTAPATHAAREDNGELTLASALEVFNAGETTQRVAGVARSLGAPAVVVRAVEDAAATAAILVAWELCWYRYEVDLGEELPAAKLVAEGMELDELAGEDRVANAVADERGRIALVR